MAKVFGKVRTESPFTVATDDPEFGFLNKSPAEVVQYVRREIDDSFCIRELNLQNTPSIVATNEIVVVSSREFPRSDVEELEETIERLQQQKQELEKKEKMPLRKYTESRLIFNP